MYTSTAMYRHNGFSAAIHSKVEAEVIRPVGRWPCLPPLMAQQPVGGIACTEQSMTLTASAQGSGPFLYQWHRDGSSKSKGQYADGEPHGAWTWWFQAAGPSLEGEFAHGREAGVWTVYHRNGQVSERGEQRDGRPYGPWASWREDGTKLVEGAYDEKGLGTGVWKHYDANGELEREVRLERGREVE